MRKGLLGLLVSKGLLAPPERTVMMAQLAQPDLKVWRAQMERLERTAVMAWLAQRDHKVSLARPERLVSPVLKE